MTYGVNSFRFLHRQQKNTSLYASYVVSQVYNILYEVNKITLVCVLNENIDRHFYKKISSLLYSPRSFPISYKIFVLSGIYRNISWYSLEINFVFVSDLERLCQFLILQVLLSS